MGLDIFILFLLCWVILNYTTAILLQHSTLTSGLSAVRPYASGLRGSARLEAFGVGILDGKEVQPVG